LFSDLSVSSGIASGYFVFYFLCFLSYVLPVEFLPYSFLPLFFS
jgi:hypothetical protein